MGDYMASIVYVCDSKMIEFHRLNGSKTINFWRPSQNKNISDFHEGDYLFFLVKGSERNKEKGICGYGHLVKKESLSLNVMWNTYQELNGYATKEAFKKEVEKLNKDKAIPKKLSSLVLEDVIFFQSPVYLSEIGIQISNKVESYFYLDKYDEYGTIKLLNKSKESGVDLWSSMYDDKTDELLENEQTRHNIMSILKQYTLKLTNIEQRKCKQLLKDKSLYYSNGIVYEGINYANNTCECVFACLNDENYKQMMIGHILLIKNKLEKQFKNVTFTYVICFDKETYDLETFMNL